MRASAVDVANALLYSSRNGNGLNAGFDTSNTQEALALGALNGIGAVEVGSHDTKAKSGAPSKVAIRDIFDGLVNLGSPRLTASVAAALGLHPLLVLGAAHSRLANPNLAKIMELIQAHNLECNLDELAEFMSNAVEKLLVTDDIEFTLDEFERVAIDRFPHAIISDNAEFKTRKAVLLHDATLHAARGLFSKK